MWDLAFECNLLFLPSLETEDLIFVSFVLHFYSYMLNAGIFPFVVLHIPWVFSL
jgi:hypothetical protein